MAHYLRANFRLTGHLVDTTKLAMTGNILQGSFTNSATKSGYISVSNVPLSGTPKTAKAMIVTSGGNVAAAGRQVYVKGIDANYVTFGIKSATYAITTGSDVTIVWAAYL